MCRDRVNFESESEFLREMELQRPDEADLYTQMTGYRPGEQIILCCSPLQCQCIMLSMLVVA